MEERSALVSVSTLLGWDEETVMPPGGVETRSRQMALLAGIEHQAMNDPALGELIDVVKASPLVSDPGSPAAVNVRELERIQRRNARLDRRLVEELARTATIAQHEWAMARHRSEFASFAPWLDRICSLKRSEAQALSDGPDPYDALLDEYEPGSRAEPLAVLFAGLAREVRPILDAIAGSSVRVPREIAHRPVELDAQLDLTLATLRTLGFDLERGRIDTAEHPFTAHIGPGDCRITTRFEPDDFSEGFFATLHELGHALYDQGLPHAHYGTPFGEAASLGMHESQARLWENMVGRSQSFWRHFFPRLREECPGQFDDVAVDDFYASVNEVAPSAIRVRADQVTYDLHIMVRFELERLMISGELGAQDVPAAWNEAYARHLGVTPPSDAMGCLQDGHWASGMFGYFPTYTLGNLIAAQLFRAARREMPSLDADFASGNFTGLLHWLRRHIHGRGKVASAAQLVQDATGEPLGYRALVEELRERACEIYRVRIWT